MPLKNNRLDHFTQEGNSAFAGQHIIIDIWGASCLDDVDLMRKFLLKSVKDCGATLLHTHLHHFGTNGGISGVAVLAESHISVHTWPEADFGAFDVFMCGDTKPQLLLNNIKEAFKPNRIEQSEFKRGKIEVI